MAGQDQQRETVDDVTMRMVIILFIVLCAVVYMAVCLYQDIEALLNEG